MLTVFSKKLIREFPLHFMLIPGLLLVLVYSYVPMLGIVIAFQKFIPAFGVMKSEWIGLDNFRFIMVLPDTKLVVWNTVFISVLKIIGGLIVPLIVSLLLNEVVRNIFKRTIQTLVYMPHFISWVILGGIFLDLLSPNFGIVNQFLGLFGIEPIFFLGSNQWFRSVLVSSDIWKEFGFSTVVFLAAITGINQSLYEAAMVDGATRWKQMWHITLPGMAPIIVLVATLSVGNVLNAGFDQVFNLYSPVVYETGDILDTFIYRLGLLDAKYGLATAVGLFKSIISFILISLSYWMAYRFADYRIF